MAYFFDFVLFFVHSFSSVLFVVSCSFLLSYTLLRIFLPVLRKRLIVYPNFRSSHNKPTPCGGGITFVLVTSALSFFAFVNGDFSALSALPLIAFPLAFTGLIDDCYNLSSWVRFLVQLLTSALIIGNSFLFQQSLLFFSFANMFFLFLIAFLLFLTTAIINFINFMDGLDGLVPGCMVVTICALSISLSAPWAIWALVGSLLGFLIWNWSPAKVFMGDVGSTFLAAVFAGLVLQAPCGLQAFGYLLLATPLLADAFFCVPRRFLAGQPVFQAHRLHLFQRLHQAGWPHSRVSLTYIFATSLLVFAMFAGGLPWLFGFVVVELFIGFWLDQRVAVPFALAFKN